MRCLFLVFSKYRTIVKNALKFKVNNKKLNLGGEIMRIAINGFGRIGRCVVRAMLERQWPEALELVAINDPGNRAAMVHLLNHDSVHGVLSEKVVLDGENLSFRDRSIPLLSFTRVEDLPWKKLQVDLVLECSGRFKNRESALQHIQAGAKRVLVSAPTANADATIVFGVNHKNLKESDLVISAASCTTNCLAPIAMVLQREFGIESGQMTTIHAYTNDQHLVDTAVDDLYRGRAGAMSMIPTKTGAAEAVGLVLPELVGKFKGMAVRVPTPDVSLIDLHCLLKKECSKEDINQVMENAAANELKAVLIINKEPLVSVDFYHNPASSIFDSKHTAVIGKQVKIMAWYDNEWGFSNRMVDVAEYIAHYG